MSIRDVRGPRAKSGVKYLPVVVTVAYRAACVTVRGGSLQVTYPFSRVPDGKQNSTHSLLLLQGLDILALARDFVSSRLGKL